MKRLLFGSLFFLILCSAVAQPGQGPPPDPGTPVPITGLEILVALGAGLGIYKIRSAKNKP
ncbi:MAG: hypothetical protein JNK18_14005 [Cyclobacteriaceae bacterium]|nr:hypothetical protein [Cyclobacteriaceae bacterium]